MATVLRSKMESVFKEHKDHVELHLFCEPEALEKVKKDALLEHQKIKKKKSALPFHLQGDESMYGTPATAICDKTSWLL